jgi:hypothetical protein
VGISSEPNCSCFPCRREDGPSKPDGKGPPQLLSGLPAWVCKQGLNSKSKSSSDIESACGGDCNGNIALGEASALVGMGMLRLAVTGGRPTIGLRRLPPITAAAVPALVASDTVSTPNGLSSVSTPSGGADLARGRQKRPSWTHSAGNSRNVFLTCSAAGYLRGTTALLASSVSLVDKHPVEPLVLNEGDSPVTATPPVAKLCLPPPSRRQRHRPRGASSSDIPRLGDRQKARLYALAQASDPTGRALAKRA